MSDDPLRARLTALVAELHEFLSAGEFQAMAYKLDEVAALLREPPETPLDAEQALREASQALDDLVAPDPSKSLAQRIRDEFADFQMVLDHCTQTYAHFSGDRISKPQTLPREVFAVAEELQQAVIEEAIAEAREEWAAARAAAAPEAS